jgi:MSHA biogenesis protein MshG
VLDEMLDRLAFLAERDADTRAKIKSATRYPVIVVVALVVAFGILVTFVIPQFAKLYANFHAALPLPTRLMIGLNTLIRSYGVLIVAAAVAAAFGLRAYVKTPAGRALWDGLKLRLPVFGSLFLKSALSRFARVFGTLNRCGLPALQALEIVAKTGATSSSRHRYHSDGARQGDSSSSR